MYRRRRRAELRHGGAGSGSGGSVANQLGGAPAEPSWSMEAEAVEQSMLTAGAVARPGPPARSCRAKASVDSTPWAAALVPRAEAVGFHIYGPKFYCVRGHSGWARIGA